MMEKHAYLLVTDLHDLGHTKNNRQNYHVEINAIKKKILETVLTYQQAGWKVFVIFLGDVFDRGYKDALFRAITANNYFVVLRQQCEVFSVVGNHELSFYNNNPFYTLITEIESEKVKAVTNKIWTPQGTLPLLRVVDRIEDGDLVIHFNHYGTPPGSAVAGKYNVGLFHQEVVCREILQEVERKSGNIFVRNPVDDFDNTDFFDGFDACFFGHLHKVYGTWVYRRSESDNPCDLVYLASLGRPAQDEVNDSFLERDIPALLVEDGKYCGYEHNVFQLLPRSESVREDVVALEQTTYRKTKELHQQIGLEFGDCNPMEGIRRRCITERQLTIFDEYAQYGTSQSCERVLREVKNKFGG